jgi:hypothetical protein
MHDPNALGEMDEPRPGDAEREPTQTHAEPRADLDADFDACDDDNPREAAEQLEELGQPANAMPRRAMRDTSWGLQIRHARTIRR